MTRVSVVRSTPKLLPGGDIPRCFKQLVVRPIVLSLHSYRSRKIIVGLSHGTRMTTLSSYGDCQTIPSRGSYCGMVLRDRVIKHLSLQTVACWQQPLYLTISVMWWRSRSIPWRPYAMQPLPAPTRRRIPFILPSASLHCLSVATVQ